MSQYKLYYFNVRNLGEPIRLLLHYKKIEFEDIRVSTEEWPTFKPEMPQGTMPVLEIDGRKIAQTQSILRYLGRVYNLTGRNNIERAIVDSIADLFKDFYTQIGPYFYIKLGFAKGNEEEKKKECLLPACETKFPFLQKYLRNAHSGYYARSGITYVDFIAAEMLSTVYGFSSDVFEEFPELVQHFRRIQGLPELKSYMASRP